MNVAFPLLALCAAPVLAEDATAPAFEKPATTGEPLRPITVVCVGDSITFGYGASDRNTTSYPARLQSLLGDGWNIVNCGHNSRTALDDGREWNGQGGLGYRSSLEFARALALKPDVVIFMLGTNDSKNVNWDGREADVKRDYKRLVADFLALEPRPTVIIGLSPYVKKDSFSIRRSVVEEQIVPFQRALAKELGLDCVDIHAVTKKEAQISFIADGIHPNDAGYTLIAEAFAAKLRELEHVLRTGTYRKSAD